MTHRLIIDRIVVSTLYVVLLALQVAMTRRLIIDRIVVCMLCCWRCRWQ